MASGRWRGWSRRQPGKHTPGNFGPCTFVRVAWLIFLDLGRVSRYSSRTVFLCSHLSLACGCKRMQGIHFRQGKRAFSCGDAGCSCPGISPKGYPPHESRVWAFHALDPVLQIRCFCSRCMLRACRAGSIAEIGNSQLFTPPTPSLPPDRSACRSLPLRRQTIHAAANAHAL